ncbi:MAG: S8 family serine peptidase [bacterium]
MKKYFSALLVLIVILSVHNLYAQTTNQQQRTFLQKFAETKSLKWQKDRIEAEALANKLGIPIRITYPDGRALELQKFENGIPKYYHTNNIYSAYTISTDKVWPGGISGLSLTGKDVLLGIWDGGGTRTTHRELIGRVTQKDIPEENVDHATHVAGTMIAKGLNPDAHGMANEASLDAYDWNDNFAEMANAAANGLPISNHSYGEITGWDLFDEGSGAHWFWFGKSTISTEEDYTFGFYTHQSAQWDTIAWNAPYHLIVKSAGNDRGEGPLNTSISHWEFTDSGKVLVSDPRPLDGGDTGFDCIGQDGVPKNILTVGGVWDLPGGYWNPADVLMMTYEDWGSCWGPTDDGRIKPDIVANGAYMFSSTAATDQSYDNFSGTSMAAPSVSGSVALLLEHQENLHPGVKLRSSTIKATVIHTADEAGPNPGPDYMFGWGLMNTASAANFMTKNSEDDQRYILLEYPLNSNETFEIPVICNQTEYIKATICWIDPPGISSAPSLDPTDIMLMNDLDMRIIGPTKTTYSPWRLDPAHPEAAASHGDNFRDNVEQIVIENPLDGTYTIRINSKHELINGPQIVSIIISAPLRRVELSSPENGLNEISFAPNLVWNEFPGASQYRVQISSTLDFVSTVFDQDAISNNYIDVVGLLPNTQYYWRVNCTTSSGVGDWSEIWTFTTGSNPTEAGYAVKYDGLEDYIQIPGHSKIGEIESNDKVTIEAWIFINNFSQGYFPIAEFYIADIDWGWAFSIYQPIGLGFSLIYSYKEAAYNFQTNRWYHVAVSYDKSQNKVKFFVNGEKIKEEPYAEDIPDTQQFNSPLFIGVNYSGGDEFSDGIIDELRIWNTARTDQQIMDNMFKKISGSPSGLVANFTFDEGSGFEVNDASGNINPGILKKSPTWVVSNAPFGLPAVPELLSPHNNSGNISVNPTFEWVSVTGASNYWLQIATDINFTNVVFNDSNLTATTKEVANLQYETVHFWRVCARNVHGSGEWSEVRGFATEVYVGIKDEKEIPTEFALFQNYPNPFNPTTVISFQLPVISKVNLKIYDILGREVAALVNEEKPAGTYEVKFDGSQLSSGIYIYKLVAGSFIQSKKLILMK